VVNHRVINRAHVVAGVSGGVRVDPSRLVSAGALQPDSTGELKQRRAEQHAPRLPPEAWWWD